MKRTLPLSGTWIPVLALLLLLLTTGCGSGGESGDESAMPPMPEDATAPVVNPSDIPTAGFIRLCLLDPPPVDRPGPLCACLDGAIGGECPDLHRFLVSISPQEPEDIRAALGSRLTEFQDCFDKAFPGCFKMLGLEWNRPGK